MDHVRFVRLACVAGIVGIVLLIIVNAQLGNHPKGQDSAESVAKKFLPDHREQALAFAALFGLGGEDISMSVSNP